jgi:Domain of unknown function (DUF4835)
MYKKIIFAVFLSFIVSTALHAQELQGKMTVLANRVSTQIDRKVFITLQTALNNFLFNRKWTKDKFQQQEKIKCNFLLNLQSDPALPANTFKAVLTIQAARPVFNSAYESPLINYLDDAVTFTYVEYQPIEFNENRVQGSDPSAANLTAILAYYVYIILGLDYDSFALKGGEPYFLKAQNIVTNAPEGSAIFGWKPFDGQRNRYWLSENLNNNRYSFVHESIYNYYRLGFDNLYENESVARDAILNSLSFLNNINTEFPNTMFIQFFMQGRSTELVQAFAKAPPDVKGRASEILQRLDIANASIYKKELR